MYSTSVTRAFLVLLFIGPGISFGADSPPSNEARLTAMRAAAKDAANRSALAPAVNRAPALRAAIPVGPIAISAVTPSSSSPIARFGQLELTVTFSAITALVTKFFEPDPILGGVDVHATFTPPSGPAMTINGFWEGTTWRVRFSPTMIGTWSYVLSATDPSGTVTTSSATFTCIASSAGGFIRCNGERFVDANGQTFHGIGHNNGWLPVVEQPAFTGPTSAIAAYTPLPAIGALPGERSMQATGENLLSFWLCSPWELPTGGHSERAPIENITQGIGNYNQDACAYLDGVVQRAETSGIRLLPSIWAHDQLRDATHPWGDGSWSNNAYFNVCSAVDFMTTSTLGGSDTEQWRRQKSFYRYLLARWGSYPAIMGWVGVVEMEGTTAFISNPTTAGAWCVSVRQWFADHDFYRLNAGTYPITFSRSDQVVFDPSSSLNVLATDSYTSQVDDVAVATTLGNNITTLRTLGKPCFHSEFGGDTGAAIPATQPLHFHNGLWADFSAGSSLSALLWCDGQRFPRVIENATGQLLQNHMSAHAKILAQIPFLGDPSLVRTKLAPTGTTTAWIQASNNHGFAWIVSNATPQVNLGGQDFVVNGILPGTYDVQWFDTWGDGIAAQTVEQIAVTGSTLNITLPTLSTPRTDQFMVFSGHFVTLPPPGGGTQPRDTSTSNGGCGLGGGLGIWLTLTLVAAKSHVQRRKNHC